MNHAPSAGFINRPVDMQLLNCATTAHLFVDRSLRGEQMIFQNAIIYTHCQEEFDQMFNHA